MGLGGFFKKLVKSPLSLGKAGLKSTGKLVHGDFKGALKTGIGGMHNVTAGLDPLTAGVGKFLAGRKAQPAMAAPQIPQLGGGSPMGTDPAAALAALAQQGPIGGGMQDQQMLDDEDRMVGGFR